MNLDRPLNSLMTYKMTIPAFVRIVVQLPFLLAGWGLLFGLMMVLTEMLLVPWDILPDPPPVGTLARSVNDFFEGSPGAYVPAVVVLGSSMVLLAYRLMYRPHRYLPLEFAAITSSMFALYVLLLSVAIYWPWRPAYGESSVGFQQNTLPILLTLLWLAILFGLKWRGYSDVFREQPTKQPHTLTAHNNTK